MIKRTLAFYIWIIWGLFFFICLFVLLSIHIFFLIRCFFWLTFFHNYIFLWTCIYFSLFAVFFFIFNREFSLCIWYLGCWGYQLWVIFVIIFFWKTGYSFIIFIVKFFKFSFNLLCSVCSSILVSFLYFSSL